MKAFQAVAVVSVLAAGAAWACDGEQQAGSVKSVTIAEVT